MLTNPYPATYPGILLRVQTFVPQLVMTEVRQLAPFHGATQIVLNNLINNLHNDIAHLTGGTLRADYASILSILLEPRPLTADQLTRLGSTSVAVVAGELRQQFDVGQANRVGEKIPSDDQSSTNVQSSPKGGKRPARKENTKEKTNKRVS